MKVPRIALSGSAGTGKTTLAQRLAEQLDVAYIEEGMRRRIEEGLLWHAMTREQQLGLIEELWQEQRAAEDAAEAGFVADRSSYDYAAFWLHYDFHADREDSSDRFDRWCSAGNRYERVFLLPWGVLPLESDGVRSSNQFVQLRFQGILEGVLRHFAPPEHVVRLPDLDDLGKRVEFALDVLGRSHADS